MLGFVVGVGADGEAELRAHIAELESGRAVVVMARDVGHYYDQGWVTLGADGSITALPEDLTRRRAAIEPPEAPSRARA